MNSKPRIDECVSLLIGFVVFFVGFPWMMICSIRAAVLLVALVADVRQGSAGESWTRVLVVVGLVFFFGLMIAMTEAIKWVVRRLLSIPKK